MCDLLIKFPTRARPDKFRTQFERYNNMLSGNFDINFIISMDNDDDKMNNNLIKSWLNSLSSDRIKVFYYYGDSKTKVEAINADVNKHLNFKVLLLASEDMRPMEKGYDNVIMNDMQKYYPKMDGALHYNDGRVGQRLNTLSIMGITMYMGFGYIYHPAYSSLWCDNEFHDVTKAMNKSTYIDRCIIKHEWVDYTGKDDLHKRNEKFYTEDQRIYLTRRRKGFPR